MIQVDIIKWRKTAKYLIWTFIICFITAMTIIVLDDKVSDVIKAIGLLLIIPSVVSLAIITFMNKSKSIGNITFNTDKFVIESDGLNKELDYSVVNKLDISNFDGRQYFSLKSIYPFYDGLNNYIWIITEKGSEKIEIKIDNERTYKALIRHFELLQKDCKRAKWKIKPV
jgi:hypothetical protein